MMRDGVCSPVVLCIILAREFAVSGLRMVAAGAKDGKVIAANKMCIRDSSHPTHIMTVWGYGYRWEE